MKVKSSRKFSLTTFYVISVTSGAGLTGISFGDPATKVEKTRPVEQVDAARSEASLPATIEDARGRARWMHEGFHGALQVMHRDFFDDDAAGTLPSQALDDVFKEMARSWSVEIRWLGVNATKGIDHEPKDRFEENAAAALAAGEKEFELVEAGRYRYVGMIRLQNECLKCHVRNRTTLEDRVAGLAISFPLRPQ